MSVNLKKHLSILGLRVKDRVTGFKGIATVVGFDLYGCIQVSVNPGLDENGKIMDAHWFDIARLNVDNESDRAMDVPSYDLKKCFAFLGCRVKDRITGFEGIATSVGLELYGACSISVNPGMGKDNKLGDTYWVELPRLMQVSTTPVLSPPNFEYGEIAEGLKGPESKPSPTRKL